MSLIWLVSLLNLKVIILQHQFLSHCHGWQGLQSVMVCVSASPMYLWIWNHEQLMVSFMGGTYSSMCFGVFLCWHSTCSLCKIYPLNCQTHNKKQSHVWRISYAPAFSAWVVIFCQIKCQQLFYQFASVEFLDVKHFSSQCPHIHKQVQIEFEREQIQKHKQELDKEMCKVIIILTIGLIHILLV